MNGLHFSPRFSLLGHVLRTSGDLEKIFVGTCSLSFLGLREKIFLEHALCPSWDLEMIYILLEKNFVDDAHPFKESYHFFFYVDDVHPFKESYRLNLVEDFRIPLVI